MNDLMSLLSTASQPTSSPLLLLASAFIGGMLVSFTPCLYPMIPITAGILQQGSSKSVFANFCRALTYISGLALIYALLGYVSATTSVLFGTWFAKPWFVVLVVGFFGYLAGSMLGLYDMYIPSFMQSNGTEAKSQSLTSIFFYGMMSGTIASPCLTPALAVILGIAGKQSNPLMGFAVMLSFALGMGMLLLVIGTFSSTLSIFPRAGAWMEEVKKLLGILMLMACVSFAQAFLGELGTSLGYAACLAIGSVIFLKDWGKSTIAQFFAIACAVGALVLAILAVI